jgi:hypothetical protein
LPVRRCSFAAAPDFGLFCCFCLALLRTAHCVKSEQTTFVADNFFENVSKIIIIEQKAAKKLRKFPVRLFTKGRAVL